MNVRFLIFDWRLAALAAVSLLAGCQSENFSPLPVPPPAPASTHSTPAAAPSPAVISPAPLPPAAALLMLRAAMAPAPQIVTNISGTNIIICGTNKINGTPFCLTNPVIVPPATNLTLAWLETNFTPGHQFLSNTIVRSTNGPAGPWQFFALVAVTDINMRVTVPTTGPARAFYRVGAPAP